MDLISVYGVLSIVVFTVLQYRLKSITRSFLFTPLVMPVMTFSISLGTVFYLFSIDSMSDVQLYTVLFFFGTFVVAIFLLKNVINKKNLLNEVNSKIKTIDYQALYFLFVIASIVTVIYSTLLWTSYSVGDERLFLNKQFRFLSLLKDCMVLWTVVLSAIIYAQHKSKKILFILAVTITLSVFTGSKGAALGYLFWALFYYFNFNLIKNYKLLPVLALIVAALFVPTYWMYGDDFFNKVIYRVGMSGDVYFMAFSSGDYRELIGIYDPIKYLLHPFTSIVGIRGYQYPLGAELKGTAGFLVDGTGPNPHLPILSLTFWPNCFYCAFLFATSSVLVFLGTVFTAFSVYNNLKLSLFFRVYLFSTLLSAAFTIFIDIGDFEFKLILCFLGFFFYMVITLLKETSQLLKKVEIK